MDYIEWVAYVMTGLKQAWEASDKIARSIIGITYLDVGVALGFSESELLRTDADKPTAAILTALKDLAQMGMVEQQANRRFFKLTHLGLRVASRGMASLWNSFVDVELEPEQAQVLAKLAEISQVRHPTYATLQEQLLDDIAGEAEPGRATQDSARLYYVVMQLEDFGLAKVGGGIGYIHARPTYKGIVLATQQLMSLPPEGRAAPATRAADDSTRGISKIRPHSEAAALAMVSSQDRSESDLTETTSQQVRSKVFISYSHADSKWLGELLKHLTPFTRVDPLDVWSDKQIAPGDVWRAELTKALASAKVAVLLVTPDFLASRFIAEEELPPLLDAAAKEGLTIMWVAVRHSAYKTSPIEKYQAVNDPASPLASVPKHKRDYELVNIAQAVVSAAKGT